MYVYVYMCVCIYIYIYKQYIPFLSLKCLQILMFKKEQGHVRK